MSKRGEQRPWLVDYQWTNGNKGRESFTSKDAADDKAAVIRGYAEHRPDADVTVTVRHRSSL